MQKESLSEKELLFCRIYALTRNARESAARAGYKILPERAGLKLLARKEISDVVECLSREQSVKGETLTGLKRLALSGISDAVKLIYRDEPLTDEQIEGLDLFMVSEIKRPKGGGIEIKFFDRIKALEKLSELEVNTDGDRALPFYNALVDGARALRGERDES